MQETPLIAVLSPARFALATLLNSGFGLGLGAAAVLVWRWRLLGDGFVDSLIFGILFATAINMIARLVMRRLNPDFLRAYGLMNEGRYHEAIDAFQRHFEGVERRRWLDTLRTFLYLDAGRYGLREVDLVNIGHCYSQSSDARQAVEYYRRALAINPSNLVALSNMNLLNLFMGEPTLPVSDLLLRFAYDRRERRRNSATVFGLWFGLFVIVFGPCSLGMALIGPNLGSLNPPVFIAGILLVIIATRSYRWIARRVFLSDIVEGIAFMRGGQFQQAAEAFQRQSLVIEAHPWIDRWRGSLLLSATSIPYREWSLLYQIAPAVCLGDRDQVVMLCNEVLKMNAHNVFARAYLNAIDAALAAVSPVGEVAAT